MTPQQVRQHLHAHGYNLMIIQDYIDTCVYGSGQGESYYQSLTPYEVCEDFQSFYDTFYIPGNNGTDIKMWRWVLQDGTMWTDQP